MKAPHEILNDPTPLKLRPVDLAEPQGLLIEAADQLREMTSLTLYLRGVLAERSTTDPERLRQRALSAVIDLHELAGRAEDTRDRLAKRLRATGRL